MTTDPFATPGTASGGIDWESVKGALLLIEPAGVETGIKTTFGEKDAIRAGIVVLDGTQAGEEFPDCLIFPGVLIGQLRSRVGQKVLGRLSQGVAKPGQKPPWLLEDPTDADRQVGISHLSKQVATAAPPF